MNPHNAWSIITSKIADFKIQKGITSFVNPYSMLMLESKDSIASKIDNWHIDGSLLVKVLNISSVKKTARFSFDETSVAPLVFLFARQNNLKVAIVGTLESVIPQAVKAIERKHGVSVTYYRNGYFATEEDKTACFEEIKEKGIDIVVCGMGTPYQEEFLIGLKTSGWNGYGFTCGGYLHQIARKENYYPPVFDKFNIRWVYRIIDEPKLFKRYFIYYPVFLLRFGFWLKFLNI